MKFCRSESAIIGSSSTTRIRTSLFSTFFSSLEIAAPWGPMVSLPIRKNQFLVGFSCRKRKHHHKLVIRQFCRAAVRLDNLLCEGHPNLFAAGKGTKRIVIQWAEARPLDHCVVVGSF